MMADNIVQLTGLAMTIIGGALAVIKSVQAFVDGNVKKAELKVKENIELGKVQVDLARTNALAATQVAELLKNNNHFVEELEKMKLSVQELKTNGEEKNKQIFELIDKIEDMLRQQTQNFTEFIMNRAK